jgi:pimeloyl-ACP methyl ester carboxylesterase
VSTAEWRTQRIEHDGEVLYFEVTGASDARTVVLTHGAGGTHASWFQQVPALAAAGYRVVTWDSRGFGNSTCNGTLGAGVAASDIARILDEVGVERVDLVGQSMGGWWASAFTIAHPDRVHTLTLANTIGGLYTPELHDHFRHVTQAAPTGRPTIGSHTALSTQLFERDPALAFLYQQLDSFHEPPLVAVARALTGWEVTHEQMNATNVPVLVITAPEDPLFPAALVRDGAGRLRDARVVEIDGAGHSPYFERAAEWNAALLDFLAAHTVHRSSTG